MSLICFHIKYLLTRIIYTKTRLFVVFHLPYLFWKTDSSFCDTEYAVVYKVRDSFIKSSIVLKIYPNIEDSKFKSDSDIYSHFIYKHNRDKAGWISFQKLCSMANQDKLDSFANFHWMHPSMIFPSSSETRNLDLLSWLERKKNTFKLL